MTRPVVLQTIADVRAALAGKRAALVPTMGALHEGHVALVQRARELSDTVVVSIFVNPTQFAPSEDLGRYPRTFEADLDRLDGLADIVFAPSVEEMYPDGLLGTRVTGGEVAAILEGASRPGHFDGVLTVVAKLLNIVRPAYAMFGQKDAQQLFLVQRMVADLDLTTRIVPVPIVRDSDGLALSSRNRYLSPEERTAALALSRALRAADAEHSVAAAERELAAEPLVRLDYLAVVDPATFHPVDGGFHGTARMLIAARVGATRLIDNATIRLS